MKFIQEKLSKYFQKSLVVAALTGLALVAACDHTPVRNPFEKRAEPALSELPELNQSQGKIDVAWSNKGKEYNSIYNKLRPFVHDNIIYSSHENGEITAVDIRSGNEIWSHKVGLIVTAGPVVIDQQLIIAAKQFIVSFDLKTGNERWRHSVSSEVVALPAGQGSTIVVHALDESVTALSSKNGQVIWQVNHSVPALTLRTKSAPVVSQDKVLVGLSSGRVVALNLYSGMIEWEYTLTTSRGRSELQRMVDISADPVVIGDTAYVVGYQGKLAALNFENGALLWERNVSAYQNMAYDQTALYITDDQHTIWALDRHTGATLWKQAQLATRYVTSPTLYQRYIVVADRGGYLHWLDSQTGHLLGRAEAGEKFYHSPIIANQSLLVREHSGKISKIDLLLNAQRSEG